MRELATNLRRGKSCERVGRIVGAAGAACASLFWGAALYAVADLLINPSGLAGFALLAAMPMAIFASLLLVVTAADVAVLARRVDIGMPSRVASIHVLMAFVVLWLGDFDRRAWFAATILIGIVATQVVALWCFRQITPSHASSQR